MDVVKEAVDAGVDDLLVHQFP